MGAVSANVAAARFYNFNPRLVARAIPAAWELASPAVVTRMRYQLVASALPRVLGEQLSGSTEVTHAAMLRLPSVQRVDLITWVRWNCQRSTMRNPTWLGVTYAGARPSARPAGSDLPLW